MKVPVRCGKEEETYSAGMEIYGFIQDQGAANSPAQERKPHRSIVMRVNHYVRFGLKRMREIMVNTINRTKTVS